MRRCNLPEISSWVGSLGLYCAMHTFTRWFCWTNQRILGWAACSSTASTHPSWVLWIARGAASWNDHSRTKSLVSSVWHVGQPLVSPLYRVWVVWWSCCSSSFIWVVGWPVYHWTRSNFYRWLCNFLHWETTLRAIILVLKTLVELWESYFQITKIPLMLLWSLLVLLGCYWPSWAF